VSASDVVPGQMRCAKCDLLVIRTDLCISSGVAAPGNNITEPCPNGCGPLWPVTWEQRAREAEQLAESLLDKTALIDAKFQSSNSERITVTRDEWFGEGE